MGDYSIFPVIKDILLFAIAAYGAALSTFNWRQAVRKERRAVAVSISTAPPSYPNGRLGEAFPTIEAVNIGQRSVTIRTLALELSNGSRLFATSSSSFPGMPDTPLPAALSDGEMARLFITYQAVAESLIHSGRTAKLMLTPVAEDTAGGVYKGKSVEFDPLDEAVAGLR
jgi:hypothetical protein